MAAHGSRSVPCSPRPDRCQVNRYGHRDPEGRRSRRDVSGGHQSRAARRPRRPRHRAGRLAVETGAPIVPAAITWTSHLCRGALRRVQIAFLARWSRYRRRATRLRSELIDGRPPPPVREEYARLAARPGLIAAALAVGGLGGGLPARCRLQGSRQPRLLGNVDPRGCWGARVAGAEWGGCAGRGR